MDKRIAIVTGGGRGIGRAIVERLTQDGLAVLTCGRGERPADLNAEVLWMCADVADPAQANALVKQANSQLGTVSVLINNAGVQVEKTVLDSTDADWDLLMGVNCRGVFNMCRAVLPDMVAAGGAIVNIGSISAVVADPTMALYNASKAFVDGLTRSIAVDHGPQVRCNTIRPGWIMTEMATDGFALANDPARAEADAIARHPVGRLGQPSDIANLAAWLISAEASYVSGASFTADGGMTAASPLNPGLF